MDNPWPWLVIAGVGILITLTGTVGFVIALISAVAQHTE